MSDVYKENGFEDRNHYLHYLSDIHDCPFWMVESMAETLGPGEDFDGLVVCVEDWVYENS